MEEAKEYKEWCISKGYKPSDANALKEYSRLKRTILLRSKMALYGDVNLDSLADYLGIARQTLSRKLKGEADFNPTEATMLKIKYNLTDEEFTQIFTKEISLDEYSTSSETIK